jgi:hypothetical protein
MSCSGREPRSGLSRFRQPSERDIFNFLAYARTLITGSDVTLLPLACPRCGGFRVTVLVGTSRLLECLDCGGRFRIVDGWEDEREP